LTAAAGLPAAFFAAAFLPAIDAAAFATVLGAENRFAIGDFARTGALATLS
jgi:hypothetical protein